MLVGRTKSAGVRVGAGVGLGGVGPLVGARRALFLTQDRRHSTCGRPQGPPLRIHSTPAPTRPNVFLRGFAKNLPVRAPPSPCTPIKLYGSAIRQSLQFPIRSHHHAAARAE